MLSPVIHQFSRMLLSFLLPAHSLAFPETTIDALLAPAVAASSEQQQQTPAAQARASASGSSTSTVRFHVRGPGLGSVGAEWALQMKNGPSSAPVLCMLLVRAPTAAALPTLRAGLLHRLYHALFQSAAKSSDYSAAGWTAVTLRRPASLVAGRGSQKTSSALADARKWCVGYLSAHANPAIAVIGAPPSTALSTAAGAFHHQRQLASPQSQPPLLTHVQLLRANLYDDAQRLRALADTESHSTGSRPAVSTALTSVFGHYLSIRAVPSAASLASTAAGSGAADFSHSASRCLGSLDTLVC